MTKKLKQAFVRWQDGSHDPYGGQKCGPESAPFGVDRYREIGGTEYSEFMSVHSPYGRNEEGEYLESASANTDVLSDEDLPLQEETDKHQSVVEIISVEAFYKLTDKQKEAWDLVMRREFSEYDAASMLKISRGALKDRLLQARKSFAAYIKSQEHRIAGGLQ